MHESIPRLSDYEVSAVNGFLPTEPPCDRLPAHYNQWETIIQYLPQMIISGRLRPHIERMPILSTNMLGSQPERRRAYSILGMMAHAYVWGGLRPIDVSEISDLEQLRKHGKCEEEGEYEKTILAGARAEILTYNEQIRNRAVTEEEVQKVPQSISIPFLEICERLQLPPVATYAGLVLWNWRPYDVRQPIDNMENIMTLQTFTGSYDEQWFYLTSVAIEARSAPIIPLMLDAISAARYDDTETVIACLRTFAERLDDLASILMRMADFCDPSVFYYRIRPFFAGSKNMEDAGLPNGVLFDTGSPDDHYVQFSGGSNAQSSIIQFFDIVLGIEHRPAGERSPTSSDSYTSASDTEGPSATQKPNFIQEMRRYMPGPHRRFLEHVERITNIRAYVEANRANEALSTAFDACLAMLRAFRDKHIAIVSRYIIVKARESRGRSTEPQHGGATAAAAAAAPSKTPLNLASANRAALSPDHSLAPGAHGRRRLRGTGGSALIPFLKQARDETGEPAINDWIRRIVNNGPGPAEAAVAAAGPGLAEARLTKMGEHADGETEIVGLAGVWKVDDSEGGICHW